MSSMNNLVFLNSTTQGLFTTIAEMENRIGVLIGVGLTYQEVEEKLTGKVVMMTSR